MKNKILIVEDEPMIVKALVDKLVRADYEVITAENGKEGLELALKNLPDLILLDIVMPVMDGITMLHKLRRNNWGKQVKVIIMTNLSDPGRITKSLLKKVSCCLVKSDWKITDLINEVKERLRNEGNKNFSY